MNVDDSDEGDNVIGFPSWRREAAGAPGVPGPPTPVDPDRTSREATDHEATDREAADREAADRDVHGRERHRETPPPTEWPPPGGGWRPRAVQAAARYAAHPERSGDRGRPALVGVEVGQQVDTDDREVWHEGATVTGEVLVRMRVDILGARTPIWRRLECHGSLTLDRLHRVLAAAFEWPVEDTRPHCFTEVRFDGRSHRTGDTFGNAWAGGGRLPVESEARLDEVLVEARDRLRYWYGPARRQAFRLGLLAEDVVPIPASAGPTPPARLVTGRRASPDVAFRTIEWYETRREGLPATDSLVATLNLDVPQIDDPAAFDAALVASRVRAAAGD